MSRRSLSAAVVAVLASLALVAPASADSRNPLNAYRVKATAKNLRTLAMAGFDVTEGRRKDGTIEVYGTARQLDKVNVKAKVVQDRLGRTTAERSAALAVPPDENYSGSDAEWTVWTRYDAVPGDGKEQYREQYDRLTADFDIVKQEQIGETYLGRPIIALKVTKDAKATSDNTRPAVLYNALQHAREWLAGETCRRTLDYFVENYGTDEEVTELVDTRELWFVCVANPDGYEYTFTDGNRLWRKNMADNDGDGVRGELGDGVDPNRNFATNFGRDDEGSSPELASETYRGPAPDSEPETQAMKNLWSKVDFVFQKNDHTAAELLLWPQGFQQYTPTPDNEIFEALAGNDFRPAIADFEADEDGVLHITGNRFDPDLSSELYITNGDTLDDAYHNEGILGFTPEGTEADDPNVSGFEFADDEDAIEAEFQRHRLFSLDLAWNAEDPENSASFLGRTTRNFYIDKFAESWGDPQAVQVTAKRSLGELRLRYRINGGAARTAPTKEWTGGERYGTDTGVYYHRVRGFVTGTRPGDRVQVWFEQVGGDQAISDSFTYRAVNESRDDVLIMAAEDYTGPSPAQDPNGPHYLSFYTKALDANRIGYDVYDVDGRDRTSPDWLGVLSHYKAVIWYTGDDFVTREPYQVPGTGTSRLALDEQIDVRDYMNEGGKLFYSGQFAGEQYSDGFEVKNYGFRQAPDSMCSNDLPEFNEDDPGEADGCITHVDDFLQYYLGAYRYVAGGNSTDEEGNLLPMDGLAGGPFSGLSWMFDGTGAGNQGNSATFVVTSSVLDPAKYPLYADSKALAGWRRPGAAPFNPFEGSFYMAAGATDQAYKRLRRTIDLTGKTSGELSFMTSYDLETDYDYMFVEAHTVGSDDDWTTLPAEEEDRTSTDTGLSCFAGGDGSDWQSLHPFLTHYQTKTGPESCDPEGTTGDWNAATGSSGGWVPWTVDLSAWAGKQVEVSITVATDPASLGLGVWVDQWSISADGASLGSGGFETDDDGWTIGPPPEGTVNPENGWARAQESFKEGGVVGTKDSVYTGFGFEGMNASARPKFMGAVMRYLGIKAKPFSSAKPSAPVASPPQAHAAKFLQRLLKANRKGRVKVRLTCTSDTACDGVLRLRRNGKTLAKKAFALDAGETAKLTLKLSKSARRLLANKGSLRVRLSVQGTDAKGGSINASRRIRLAR